MFKFLLFCLLLCSYQLHAQLNISCNYRETCLFNPQTEEFDICEKIEDNSLFKINEGETMFVHTTESMKSAYYIEKKNKDENTGIWELQVTSDVGNPYLYYVDIEGKEIRVIARVKEEFILIRFYIKRAW